MGIYALKPAFRRTLQPIARGLGGTPPDLVSLAAVLVAAVAGACLWLAPSYPLLYLAAPLLFFVRIAANALDGMLAQAQGTQGPRGELVNELSDRLSDAFILVGLALGGAVNPHLAWGALALTLIVAYAGLIPRAAGGTRSYAGPMGKADRMALLGLGAILAYAGPRLAGPVTEAGALDGATAVLILGSLVTLANRVRFAWRELGRIPG